jgi:hypothetical protein
LQQQSLPKTGYNFSVMPPAPAGQRLRKLLNAVGLNTAAAAKIAGFPYRSGLQYHVDSTQPYFHPRVIAKLANLIGRGSPPITEAQIQALAIIGGGGETGFYPQPTVTDKSQLSHLQSSTHEGRVGEDRGGKAMEADLLRGLIEDMGVLKKRISDLETEVDKMRHPTGARRQRS